MNIWDNPDLLVLSGSQLYGYATPESDEDLLGFVAPSLRTELGMINRFEQKTPTKEELAAGDDTKIYSLKKFISQLSRNDTQCLEILFAPETHIKICTWVGKWVIDKRDIFISKHLHRRFAGYSYSEFRKVQGVGLEPVKQTPSEQQVIDQLRNLFRPDKKQMDDIQDILYSNRERKEIPIFHKLGKARKESIKKYGYSCYTEDTKFLTQEGWKYYDEISDNEKIGTVNQKTKNLEFQKFSERVKTKYHGPIYEIENRYSRFSVTPNHRIYVSPTHRGPKNNYSSAYNKSLANWDFHSCEELMKGKRSHFHILTSFQTSHKYNKKFDTDMLILFGIYVSDGTLNKLTKNNRYRAVRIYQSVDKGKKEFITFMNRIADRFDFKRYRSREGMFTWVSYDKDLVNNLQNLFGHNSHKKRINNIIYDISDLQLTSLLWGMFLGDGSDHPQSESGWIYHSVNENLANDVQLAALLTGHDSKVMGPYKSVTTKGTCFMYQVWVSKKTSQPKNVIFNTNIKKYPEKKKSGKKRGGIKYEYDGHVVCFTVPNEILITKKGGTIAIQGNTKNAAHCIRLLMEGTEILETGKLIYPLSPEKLDVLRNIRAGKPKFEMIKALFEHWTEALNTACDKSPLPEKLDMNEINDLFLDITERIAFDPR